MTVVKRLFSSIYKGKELPTVPLDTLPPMYMFYEDLTIRFEDKATQTDDKTIDIINVGSTREGETNTQNNLRLAQPFGENELKAIFRNLTLRFDFGQFRSFENQSELIYKSFFNMSFETKVLIKNNLFELINFYRRESPSKFYSLISKNIIIYLTLDLSDDLEALDLVSFIFNNALQKQVKYDSKVLDEFELVCNEGFLFEEEDI